MWVQLNWQSAVLPSRMLRVQAPLPTPFIRPQLSWQSSCLLSKESRVQIPPGVPVNFLWAGQKTLVHRTAEDFRYYAPIAQMGEAIGSNPIKCGSESHPEYQMRMQSSGSRRGSAKSIYVAGSNPAIRSTCSIYTRNLGQTQCRTNARVKLLQPERSCKRCGERANS